MWYDTLGKCVKKEGNLYRVNLICVSRLSRFISDFLFKQVTSKHRLHQFVSWRLSCSTGYMLTLLCWDRTSPSTSSRSDAGPLGSDHHIVTWDHTHLCLCFYLKNAPVQFADCMTMHVPMTQKHTQTHKVQTSPADAVTASDDHIEAISIKVLVDIFLFKAKDKY